MTELPKSLKKTSMPLSDERGRFKCGLVLPGMRAGAAVADGAQVPPEDAQGRPRAVPARRYNTHNISGVSQKHSVHVHDRRKLKSTYLSYEGCIFVGTEQKTVDTHVRFLHTRAVCDVCGKEFSSQVSRFS